MRRGPHAAALALALMVGAHSAQAATQLFKCVIDKRTVYQQQACPINAEPAPIAASAAPSAAAPHGGKASASAPPRGIKPVSRAPSSVPATPR